ncbi:MAG TPA: hypothetical protein VEG62_04515 [Acidimicrobiales bacterium]|nr:hypothetical protein [Acidimicrobiales bacterium]HXZ61984.1 hypothetical protein [Acidimicrobiales bacterium]
MHIEVVVEIPKGSEPGKATETLGWAGAEEAEQVVARAREAFSSGPGGRAR